MKLMKSKFALLALLLLTAILLGAGFMYSGIRAEQERQKALELAKKEREAAVKEYEDVLTGFVENISQEMKAYKTQRTILREITRAHNFQTKEDAQTNYNEFKGVIVPALRAQGDKILSVFDTYGKKIDSVLQSKPEETKLFIQSRWAMMRDEEYQYYKLFFEADARVLMAHEELLKFYADTFGTYKIVEDKFIFDEPEDQKAEKDLLAIIKSMQTPDNQVRKSP